MSQGRSFAVRQIVWAKVGDYPWWPGRIINILQQNDTDVYKVNFFGDPTYCYLYPNSLMHFHELQIPTQQSLNWDQKLKKPLQLAIGALKKNVFQSVSNLKSVKEPSLTIPSPSSFAQNKIEQKKNIEILDRASFQEETQTTSQSLQTLMKVEPDISNVIDLLHSNIVPKLKDLKGYNHRKKSLPFIQNLKTNLLRKYNLELIPQVQQSIEQQLLIEEKEEKEGVEEGYKKKPMIKHQFLLKRTIKEKKIKKKGIICFRRLVIRKIFKLLKNKNISSSDSQILSLKIIEKLDEQFSNMDGNFKKNYIALMKWIQSAEVGQIIHFDTVFFGDVISKKDDCENSKLTQISIMEQ